MGMLLRWKGGIEARERDRSNDPYVARERKWRWQGACLGHMGRWQCRLKFRFDRDAARESKSFFAGRFHAHTKHVRTEEIVTM